MCAARLDYQFLAAELALLHTHLSFDYQIKAHPSVIRKLYALLIPTVDEQRAIASVLADMDAEITALEQQRDKTRALKQGMMQQLLTGRIRLVEGNSSDRLALQV
jgi:type I restriction enzyme, S subunit